MPDHLCVQPIGRSKMNVLRWLTFLPVATIAAVGTGFALSSLFPERSFEPDHLLLSVVHPRGLAGYIVPRFSSAVVFVLLGSLLAPGTGRKVVISLALLGGVFSFPPPAWPGAEILSFYSAAVSGALVGCAVGMLFGFHLRRRRSSRSSEIRAPDAALRG